MISNFDVIFLPEAILTKYDPALTLLSISSVCESVFCSFFENIILPDKSYIETIFSPDIPFVFIVKDCPLLIGLG